MCAAHVNNASSTLVKCADFSEFLSGATVGWFKREFFRINNIELKCSSSGAENITSHDEMAPPTFTSR